MLGGDWVSIHVWSVMDCNKEFAEEFAEELAQRTQ